MSDTLLREMLAKNPLNTSVRLQLANLLTLAGSYREAEQILSESITADDAHRDLLMQHGESLLDTDQPELAVNRFREVLQLVPNNADALASLGGALLRIGAHAEAADVLSRAANFLPHDAIVHKLSGEALAAIDCRLEAVPPPPILPVTFSISLGGGNFHRHRPRNNLTFGGSSVRFGLV